MTTFICIYKYIRICIYIYCNCIVYLGSCKMSHLPTGMHIQIPSTRSTVEMDILKRWENHGKPLPCLNIGEFRVKLFGNGIVDHTSHQIPLGEFHIEFVQTLRKWVKNHTPTSLLKSQTNNDEQKRRIPEKTREIWQTSVIYCWLIWNHMGVSENSVPLFTQWFCWSLSLLNGYFIGNIPNIFRQTHMNKPWQTSVVSTDLTHDQQSGSFVIP